MGENINDVRERLDELARYIGVEAKPWLGADLRALLDDHARMQAIEAKLSARISADTSALQALLVKLRQALNEGYGGHFRLAAYDVRMLLDSVDHVQGQATKTTVVLNIQPALAQEQLAALIEQVKNAGEARHG